jgi:hypothetical protein
MVGDCVRPATMQAAWRAEEELDDAGWVAAWRTAGQAIFNFADVTNLNGPALSGDGAGPRAERAG